MERTISIRRNALRGMSATFILMLMVSVSVLALPTQKAEAAVSTWQQKGISFYPATATDFASSGFRATVDHYKSLGFNTVTLIVQVYQTYTSTTDIGSGGNTPTDASLVSAIQYAHSQGMHVMLKIHLDTKDGQWRANINPSDRAGWYANYVTMLKHYGQIAEANHAEAFCLGTELIDMSSSAVHPENTAAWQDMISQVRQIYHGQLTYDANWGSDRAVGEAQYINFWPSLDFIGISAYYPLGQDGSVAALNNAWNGWNASEIQPLHDKWNKPIVFAEVGYRSDTNAHVHPFNSWDTGSYDPQEQVNDYEALFQSWDSRSFMQGVDIWYSYSDPNGGGAGNHDYTPLNKPVEQTIQKWLGGGATATSTPSAPAAFSTSGSANPASASTGQQVAFQANVQDTGGAAFGTNVDLELYDSAGHLLSQKIYDSQSFGAGQTRTYALNWTPNSAGTYTFKIGVFDSAWKLYTWNNSAAQVVVGGSVPPSSGGGTGTTTGTSTPPTTTPPPSSTGSVTDVWWPSDGATVSGLQPFKALVENVALSAYRMFWQVDGGQLNQMNDSQTDYPHKEALVNLAGWNWKGTGPYTITFVSKDTGGTVISQKAVSIRITQ